MVAAIYARKSTGGEAGGKTSYQSAGVPISGGRLNGSGNFSELEEKQRRLIILSAAAQKILKQQLEAHPGSELVFPGPDGRPYSREHIGRVFRRAARGAGLKDFHFHDLRHHGVTMALNRGFTAPIVMALGGWKTERMMRRYAAVTDQALRLAAEAVSGNEGRHTASRDYPVKSYPTS